MRGACAGSADPARSRRGLRAQHHDAAAEAVVERLPERREIGLRVEQRSGDEQQLHVGQRLAASLLRNAVMPPGRLVVKPVPKASPWLTLSARRSSRMFCRSGPGSLRA